MRGYYVQRWPFEVGFNVKTGRGGRRKRRARRPRSLPSTVALIDFDEILFHFDMEGRRISTAEYIARSRADPLWRRVARTEIGERYVSTVLLTCDHNFGLRGPPVIFESMTFPENDPVERYTTREAAVEGHARMVAQLEARQ